MAIPLVWNVWDEKSLPASIQYLFSSTLPIVSFLLLKEEYQTYVVKTYLRLILYLFIPGFLIYLLINVISLPHLNYVRDLDKRSYENYFFLYYTQDTVRFRFSSVFDEPGVVGSLAAIVVLYYRRFLSQKEYLAYIIAGVLSVSLFFIITFPILYYFSDIRDLSNRQRIRKIFTVIAAFIVFYFTLIAILNQLKEIPLFEFAVYNRFKWENGLIIGVVDNRDILEGFNNAYDKLMANGGTELLFGKGKNSVTEEFGASGLSYRITIYEKGIVIVSYMLLLIILIQHWRKQLVFSVISLIFILLLLYQRTLFFKIDYFILIFVGSGILTKYAKEKNSPYNT
ncbi:hypothetical protein [Chitinophaga sp. 212800010-3]|uniref:hypothetical protein n=1 Tax=unclassified Chitinophaga TaxID=2619133 RepID=UPI002E0E93E2